MTRYLVSEMSQLNLDLAINGQGLLQKNGRHLHETLPGQPRIKLEEAELSEYLRSQLLVPQLDSLAGKLWLVSRMPCKKFKTFKDYPSEQMLFTQVSTPRSSHISPLHHQAARGRKDIIVVENPHLHLVWVYDRIFIKPIPRYLLSHAFWRYLGLRHPELYRAAAGFIRSYSYLIRYESDFRLAQSDTLCLIPTDDGDGKPITYERFALFIASFAQLSDADVSARYEFGELRLTRLNILTRLLLRKLTFHHIDAQWSSYLGHFITPLLSVFFIITLPLSAMQVALTVQSLENPPGSWDAFAQMARWFSISTLVVVAMSVVFLATLVVFLFVHDIWFAQSVLRRKRAGKDDSTFKSGAI